jgi:Tol biopolymer transport system component
MVLSLDTGQPIEVVGQLAGGALRGWAPDGSLTYQGIDLKGRPGIFRVDPRDGSTAPLAIANEGFLTLPSWSEDGRFLVYRHQIPTSPELILRDMTSGIERNLVPAQPFGYFAIAPDGRHVAFTEGAKTPHSVRVVDVGTGATRELLKLPETEVVSVFQWLPDSQRIVVWKSLAGRTSGAVISLTGDPPVTLDGAIPENAQIHPDGRRIAYETGTATLEVWALEHFLPAVPRTGR